MKRLMVLYILLVIFTVGLTGQPRYIFYFIGDGMGPNQVYLAELYQKYLTGQDKSLHIDKIPVTGMYTTHAINRLITCSAAAGTAMATGTKTSPGTLGLTASHDKKLKTIAEELHEKGFKIGIVTSVSPDHATPAAFYAHQPQRDAYYQISIDLANSDFEYFAGGDYRSIFAGQGSKNSKLYAVEKGYKLVNSIDDFNKLTSSSGKIIVLSPVISKGFSLPYTIDSQTNIINLTDFTLKGIELLNNANKGFFMMIEGGKIDWACHRNDPGATLHEMLAFDDAIGEALNFYNENQQNTLIIVAADHETGGLAMGYTITGYELYIERLKNQKISAEKFEEIIKTIKEKDFSLEKKWKETLKSITLNFGLNSSQPGMELTNEELSLLRKAFDLSMSNVKIKNDDDQNLVLYGEYDPLVVEVTRLLSHKCGIDWTTFEHTGMPLPIRAIGAGSEKFTGYFDNTDIPKKILETVGLRFPD